MFSFLTMTLSRKIVFKSKRFRAYFPFLAQQPFRKYTWFVADFLCWKIWNRSQQMFDLQLNVWNLAVFPNEIQPASPQEISATLASFLLNFLFYIIITAVIRHIWTWSQPLLFMWRKNYFMTDKHNTWARPLLSSQYPMKPRRSFQHPSRGSEGLDTRSSAVWPAGPLTCASAPLCSCSHIHATVKPNFKWHTPPPRLF